MTDGLDDNKKTTPPDAPFSARFRIALGAIAIAVAMAIVIGVVLLALSRPPGDAAPEEPAPSVPGAPAAATPDLPPLDPEVAELATAIGDRNRAHEASLRVAFEVARQFLAADTVAGRAAFVRDRERVAPLMEDYYAREGAAFARLEKKLAEAMMDLRGRELAGITFLTPENERRSILLVKNDSGNFEVEWESFVASGEMSWPGLLARRPTHSVLLRAYATAADYHNFEFSDPERFASFRLEDREKQHLLYGFADRNSEAGRAMIAAVAEKQLLPVIVRVSFTEGSRAPDCVRIDAFVQEKWLRFSPGNG